MAKKQLYPTNSLFCEDMYAILIKKIGHFKKGGMMNMSYKKSIFISVVLLFSVLQTIEGQQTKIQQAKEWVTHNKGKIIALGLAAVALLGAGYLVAKEPRLKVIRVYENKHVNMPEDREMRNSLYWLGLLVNEKGIEGLQDLLKNQPGFRNDFTVMLQLYTNLDAALAELAGVSVEDIQRLLYAKRGIVLGR